MSIEAPFEILDLPAEGELVTRVLRWDTGELFITNRTTGEHKSIGAVRLHVPAEDKLHAPAYWDVTSTTLRPSLVAALPDVVREKRWMKIRKYGVAPRARFSLEVFPPGQGGPAFTGVRR